MGKRKDCSLSIHSLPTSSNILKSVAFFYNRLASETFKLFPTLFFETTFSSQANFCFLCNDKWKSSQHKQIPIRTWPIWNTSQDSLKIIGLVSPGPTSLILPWLNLKLFCKGCLFLSIIGWYQKLGPGNTGGSESHHQDWHLIAAQSLVYHQHWTFLTYLYPSGGTWASGTPFFHPWSPEFLPGLFMSFSWETVRRMFFIPLSAISKRSLLWPPRFPGIMSGEYLHCPTFTRKHERLGSLTLKRQGTSLP